MCIFYQDKMNLLLLTGLSYFLCVVAKEKFVMESLLKPRIMNGDLATEGQFPYQISLLKNGYHHCGGSIISNIYILTAGHCIITISYEWIPITSLQVRAGSNNCLSGGTLISVAETKLYPSYAYDGTFESMNDDIALIKLATPLEFSQLIQPIKLATSDLTPGSKIVISGWGLTVIGGTSPANLRYTALAAVDDLKCQEYGHKDWAICLGRFNANGLCHGDSGGPATFDGYLVGIASFIKNGKCAIAEYDGYTKVLHFLDWIHKNSDVKAVID